MQSILGNKFDYLRLHSETWHGKSASQIRSLHLQIAMQQYSMLNLLSRFPRYLLSSIANANFFVIKRDFDSIVSKLVNFIMGKMKCRSGGKVQEKLQLRSYYVSYSVYFPHFVPFLQHGKQVTFKSLPSTSVHLKFETRNLISLKKNNSIRCSSLSTTTSYLFRFARFFSSYDVAMMIKICALFCFWMDFCDFSVTIEMEENMKINSTILEQDELHGNSCKK